MNTATIFNIQRFSTHDGPGIRTVIFFKGCPLKCLWCANPESQLYLSELEVIPSNCIGCGACQKACPNGAISFPETGIQIDRKKCKRCGICAKECYSKTLKYVGEEMTARQVASEIKKDEVFYRNSGGGYTFSGGEPLSYGAFCLDVIENCKLLKCHSAMETSGFGDTELLKQLAGKLDLIFFDIKHMSATAHKALTGVANTLILENIKAIQKYAKEVIVRTPIVPGYNDGIENIAATAELCRELEAVKIWEMLPYHNLGEHKYAAIGAEYQLLNEKRPSEDHMQSLMETANKILAAEGKSCKLESSGQKL